ncbi:MAG: metallophosphoesterase [Pseudomonadota bacterium]
MLPRHFFKHQPATAPTAERSHPAAIREGVRIYAIGDIHGRFDLLGKMLAAIDADRANGQHHHSLEVYIGDYVDRGPHSANVIAELMARRESAKSAEQSLVFLRGNHEQACTDFLDRKLSLAGWLSYGGDATFESYRQSCSQRLGEGERAIVDEMDTIGRHEEEKVRWALDALTPPSHHIFLRALPFFFVFDDYFFCHAGVDPTIPLERQPKTALMTIREPFLSTQHMLSKRIVHGHTPVSEVEIRANRINVDSGAFSSGVLSAVVLEGQGTRILAVDDKS